MEPCEGNCVYGDPLYGNDPTEYDGSNCGCVRCPNFQFCKTWAAPIYLSFNNGCCMGPCKMLPRLTFVDGIDECVVCHGTKALFVCHPSNCGHKLCIDCFREWNTEPTPPDARAYGFSVLNEAGKCWYCDKFCGNDEEPPCAEALQLWSEACPMGYNAWAAEMTTERSDPAICPMCRKHYQH